MGSGGRRERRSEGSDEARPRRSGARQTIPAQVKRAVWERDGYRCTYVSPDGRRCESRWQLELDHAESVALGGPSTVEKIRGRCRVHNVLHAEEVFGREHMARFRRKGRPGPRTGESAIASESAQSVKHGTTPPAAGPRRKS
jgi:5-methylcytosine-specific restriction endonuclease McrA